MPLVDAYPDPLHVPGVEHRIIEGPALKYTLVLPLRTMTGEEVFSPRVEKWLMQLLYRHFRGSTSFRSDPIPLGMGAWAGRAGVEYELVNIFMVYSRVAEQVTDELFRGIGISLRGMTTPEQDDILIERVVVQLVSCRRDGEPLQRLVEP